MTTMIMMVVVVWPPIEQLIQLSDLVIVRLAVPVDHLDPRERHPGRQPHGQRLAILGEGALVRDCFLTAATASFVAIRVAFCGRWLHLEHLVGVFALDGRQGHPDEERVEEVEEDVIEQGEEEGAQREVLLTLRLQCSLTI